jgi:hypothetical protein
MIHGLTGTHDVVGFDRRPLADAAWAVIVDGTNEPYPGADPMTANDISIALLIEHEQRVARASRASDPTAASPIRRLVAWIAALHARHPALARG